jgi:hypothetical protein
MTLTKDQILECNDLKSEAVSVPEWSGSINVRMMNGTDRDAFEKGLVIVGPDGSRTPNYSDMRARLVALTAVDDDGNRIFSDEDVALLARKSAAALDRVCLVAQRLNGIGAAAEEEAEKN